jgi:hypothetical protein
VKLYSEEILDRVKERTLYGLETGMPVDVAWSIEQVNLFESWIATGFGTRGTNCEDPPTFYQDILPLFREKDIEDMKSFFDMKNYLHVKERAPKILSRLMLDMPCDGLWPSSQIDKFRKWIDCGFQEGTRTASTTERPFIRL